VLIKDGYEAYGIQYRKFGKKYKVRAKKGVILSAGVVGTPKILMLSGIGPEQHLRSHGVSGVHGLFLLQLRKFREYLVGLWSGMYHITCNVGCSSHVWSNRNGAIFKVRGNLVYIIPLYLEKI
jgi:choline dehydrogenase-like flavoprotein